MAKYKKQVPKHPTDADKTVEAVCKVIRNQNKVGDLLTSFDIAEDEVTLTFLEAE